jgi:hypothetical protein
MMTVMRLLKILTFCAAATVVACTGAPRRASVEVAALAGKWSSTLNGDVMIVARDGSFRWGRPYSGRFAMAGTGQIMMSLRENGKFMAGVPVVVSAGADTLRLTPSVGQALEFHRLRQTESDSTYSDR